MVDKGLHFCFEAKDDRCNSVYVIYTAKHSDLWLKSADSPPRFTREAVITNGVPSMGCGVFGSKLVLAGGYVKSQIYDYNMKYKGVITYDLTSKELSTSEIPSMPGGKLRPLVFQLDNKLYVLDTSKNPNLRHGSFEAFYPKQRCWHQLYLPYDRPSSHKLADPLFKGINFSWFVFAHCVYLSFPNSTLSFFHHAKFRYETFHPTNDRPLPFPGMAITYYQHNFQEDVVLITFSKGGLIEGRRLRFPFCFNEKPVEILDTKIYSQHDGDLTGCFSQFGRNTFCLTAFDNVDIYVHMFKISRLQCKKGQDLKIRLIDRRMHRYKYTDFSEAGLTSLSFTGCFSPSSPPGWSKESTEAKIYSSQLPCGRCLIEENDEPGTECSNVSNFSNFDYGTGEAYVDPDN